MKDCISIFQRFDGMRSVCAIKLSDGIVAMPSEWTLVTAVASEFAEAVYKDFIWFVRHFCKYEEVGKGEFAAFGRTLASELASHMAVVGTRFTVVGGTAL